MNQKAKKLVTSPKAPTLRELTAVDLRKVEGGVSICSNKGRTDYKNVGWQP